MPMGGVGHHVRQQQLGRDLSGQSGGLNMLLVQGTRQAIVPERLCDRPQQVLGVGSRFNAEPLDFDDAVTGMAVSQQQFPILL